MTSDKKWTKRIGFNLKNTGWGKWWNLHLNLDDLMICCCCCCCCRCCCCCWFRFSCCWRKRLQNQFGLLLTTKVFQHKFKLFWISKAYINPQEKVCIILLISKSAISSYCHWEKWTFLTCSRSYKTFFFAYEEFFRFFAVKSDHFIVNYFFLYGTNTEA